MHINFLNFILRFLLVIIKIFVYYTKMLSVFVIFIYRRFWILRFVMSG
ncbi:hypothetical protein RUMHYD_00988 [Blautia hydrogenotrophica DSM 10507]|uniref:Uncharacterized protein n=1 Tax=Blautia hydrogenotrophica (strain DSM 10507 / JCM 14656 / S5a33) TaxID=476272 RepID=C0CJJ1_BLAHS|nr:hypothetical protein RUMHYD_00988 [Blautia hydrogenotrophica DSM 10507]